MISDNEKTREKMFIEKYIYGKDELGNTRAGGYPMKEYMDSNHSPSVGFERLKELSVPAGLVHIRPQTGMDIGSGGDGIKQLGGGKNFNREPMLLDTDIFDKLFNAICQTKFLNKMRSISIGGGNNKTKKMRIKT